jgi:hypothetical protein
MEGNDYFIYIGDTLVGVAKDAGNDMPNTIGMFDPMPEFEKVKHLFDKEHELITGSRSKEQRKIMDGIFALGLRLEHKRTGEIIKSTPGRIPGPTFRNEIAYSRQKDLVASHVNDTTKIDSTGSFYAVPVSDMAGDQLPGESASFPGFSLRARRLCANRS